MKKLIDIWMGNSSHTNKKYMMKRFGTLEEIDLVKTLVSEVQIEVDKIFEANSELEEPEQLTLDGIKQSVVAELGEQESVEYIIDKMELELDEEDTI